MNQPSFIALRPVGWCGLTLAAALACAAGCDKQDPIRVYSAPKEAAAPAASPGLPSATPMASAAEAIEWTVPEGWEKQPPRAIVYAAFKFSKDDPKAECTVTRLGPQPDLLLQNVNRWEGQLHLPKSPEAELPKVVKDTDLPAGKAQIVDLTSPDPAPGDAGAGPKQHMVAIILPHGGETWFLKITGPAALVDAERPKFDAFVKSVKFPAAGAPGAPGAPSNDAQAGPTEPPQKLSKWVTPAGWKQDEKPQTFRDLSFQVAADDKPGEKAEVSVARLPGANVDVLAQDVNMWRGQVGLEPVTATQFNELGLEHVEVTGSSAAALFQCAGPKADNPDKRVIVVMVPRGGEIWFFKISGSAGLVQAQKPAFLAFVNSVEFTAK